MAAELTPSDVENGYQGEGSDTLSPGGTPGGVRRSRSSYRRRTHVLIRKNADVLEIVRKKQKAILQEEKDFKEKEEELEKELLETLHQLDSKEEELAQAGVTDSTKLKLMQTKMDLMESRDRKSELLRAEREKFEENRTTLTVDEHRVLRGMQAMVEAREETKRAQEEEEERVDRLRKARKSALVAADEEDAVSELLKQAKQKAEEVVAFKRGVAAETKAVGEQIAQLHNKDTELRGKLNQLSETDPERFKVLQARQGIYQEIECLQEKKTELASRVPPKFTSDERRVLRGLQAMERRREEYKHKEEERIKQAAAIVEAKRTRVYAATEKKLVKAVKEKRARLKKAEADYKHQHKENKAKIKQLEADFAKLQNETDYLKGMNKNAEALPKMERLLEVSKALELAKVERDTIHQTHKAILEENALTLDEQRVYRGLKATVRQTREKTPEHHQVDDSGVFMAAAAAANRRLSLSATSPTPAHTPPKFRNDKQVEKMRTNLKEAGKVANQTVTKGGDGKSKGRTAALRGAKAKKVALNQYQREHKQTFNVIEQATGDLNVLLERLDKNLQRKATIRYGKRVGKKQGAKPEQVQPEKHTPKPPQIEQSPASPRKKMDISEIDAKGQQSNDTLGGGHSLTFGSDPSGSELEELEGVLDVMTEIRENETKAERLKQERKDFYCALSVSRAERILMRSVDRLRRKPTFSVLAAPELADSSDEDELNLGSDSTSSGESEVEIDVQHSESESSSEDDDPPPRAMRVRPPEQTNSPHKPHSHSPAAPPPNVPKLKPLSASIAALPRLSKIEKVPGGSSSARQRAEAVDTAAESLRQEEEEAEREAASLLTSRIQTHNIPTVEQTGDGIVRNSGLGMLDLDEEDGTHTEEVVKEHTTPTAHALAVSLGSYDPSHSSGEKEGGGMSSSVVYKTLLTGLIGVNSTKLKESAKLKESRKEQKQRTRNRKKMRVELSPGGEDDEAALARLAEQKRLLSEAANSAQEAQPRDVLVDHHNDHEKECPICGLTIPHSHWTG